MVVCEQVYYVMNLYMAKTAMSQRGRLLPYVQAETYGWKNDLMVSYQGGL